jgi:hypothetical protein
MNNKDLIKNMHELESKILSNVSKEINNTLEKIIRENANPPIKGEITKGKLRWRGIKLCVKTTIGRDERWIEQRGVIIGQPVVIGFGHIYDPNKTES